LTENLNAALKYFFISYAVLGLKNGNYIPLAFALLQFMFANGKCGVLYKTIVYIEWILGLLCYNATFNNISFIL